MIYREASSELKQVPIAGEHAGAWWMWLHDSWTVIPEAVCTTSPALRGHFFNEESAMNDKAIEQEIQAKGKTAPRVTPDQIESVINSEHYFTGYDGRIGALSNGEDIPAVELDDANQLRLLTFCVLILENGFTVTGESACASPENFDAEIGRKIARANAVQKIWTLEGYLLKQKLHDDQ